MNVRGYGIVVLYALWSFFVQAPEGEKSFLDTEDAACLSDEERTLTVGRTASPVYRPSQNKSEQKGFVIVKKKKSSRPPLQDPDNDASSDEEGVGCPMPQGGNNGYHIPGTSGQQCTAKPHGLQLISGFWGKFFQPNIKNYSQE